ncbi:hypothetical protein CNR22_13590 [Sphingobacteriaceae bacterium]|nr:hypothetical protein CNR22_13590 [Sphingobacteriaceae bacterium]
METNNNKNAEANIAIVRQYFTELDSTKKVPEHLLTSDFVFNVSGFPPMDVAADQQFTKLFFDSMPDLKHPYDEIFASGDLICYRGRYNGTHTGAPFMGVPATGSIVDATGIGVVRVVGGKIAELWISPDRMTIMQQLGVLPK